MEGKNNLNKELHSEDHKTRRLVGWIVFYSLMIGAVIFGLMLASSRIRTQTLPVGQIKLSIAHSEFLLGEPITFTIINDFNSTAYVMNRCPTEPLNVYKKEGETWVRIRDETISGGCSDDQRKVGVAPNSTLTSNFDAWPNLFVKPGKYRIVAMVEHSNDLPYQDFEIIAKPVVPVTSSPTTQPTSTSQATSSSQNIEQISDDARKSQTITINEGEIVVEYDNTNIYVISINPASGYVYEGGRSGPNVEITFKKPGQETQLQLRLINGQIVQRIERDD